jgi:photosystem II stability/assembly factor-like uncharacterized protein
MATRKNKKMKYLLSLLLVSAAMLITPAIALASNQSGIVTKVIVRTDGLHWFYLEGTRSERPACSAQHEYWMIKDENSVYGKSQFSMLLTAYIAKSPVTISGNGTCSRWGDGEDINTIILE